MKFKAFKFDGENLDVQNLHIYNPYIGRESTRFIPKWLVNEDKSIKFTTVGGQGFDVEHVLIFVLILNEDVVYIECYDGSTFQKQKDGPSIANIIWHIGSISSKYDTKYGSDYIEELVKSALTEWAYAYFRGIIINSVLFINER